MNVGRGQISCYADRIYLVIKFAINKYGGVFSNWKKIISHFICLTVLKFFKNNNFLFQISFLLAWNYLHVGGSVYISFLQAVTNVRPFIFL